MRPTCSCSAATSPTSDFWRKARRCCRRWTPCRFPSWRCSATTTTRAARPRDCPGSSGTAASTLLDGSAWELDGVGFAGVKGFGVGFAPHRLSPFGEAAIKQFVDVAVGEAAALERALAELDTRRRVVVLHYSPIAATLSGEPPEIYPFLGDSLLEEVIDRHGADVIVHGHAHEGVAEGVTDGGIRVLNVSRQVLGRGRGGPPYVTFDVPPAS